MTIKKDLKCYCDVQIENLFNVHFDWLCLRACNINSSVRNDIIEEMIGYQSDTDMYWYIDSV